VLVLNGNKNVDEESTENVLYYADFRIRVDCGSSPEGKTKTQSSLVSQHPLRYRNDEIQLLLFIYYAKTVHKNIRIYTTNIP